MKKIYQSIWIELPYPVVQIVDINMTEGVNCHAHMQVTAICEDEEQDEFLNRPVEHESVQAGYIKEGADEEAFFTGRIQEMVLTYDKGQLAVTLTAVSMTHAWDIVRRRRTFQDMDATYGEVIGQVLAAYPGASWISTVDTTVNIPGFLLQYDETDWEFLCRLASHFEAYIMEDPSGESGQIYFGIPELNYGNRVDSDHYQISQDMENYLQYAQNVAQGMMLQNNLNWLVCSREAYKLGETVIWKYVSCQIVSVSMTVKGSEILYFYVLGRSEGVRARYYGNPKISGLSLPATIRERSGNRLRVQFAIDPEYRPGNNFYFTYAIETISWYCLPELGSTVHIYFQNWNEFTGIAVQAMRRGGTSRAGSVPEKGAVEDKSFSTTDGKAIQFTDTGIHAASVSDAASFTVSKDGTLSMDAGKIVLCAQEEMNIGKGKVRIGEEIQEVIPKNTILQVENGVAGLGIVSFEEDGVNLAEDKGIQIDMENSIWLIASGTLNYKPVQTDPPQTQYSDAELRKEDAAQREAHNAEVFEVQEREASGKMGVGSVIAGIGAGIATVGLLCLVGAATVVSGGTALLAVGAGTTAFLFGKAKAQEGVQEFGNMSVGDFSQPYNEIRDGVLGGFEKKQEIYDTIMYGSVMIGLGVLLAPLGATAVKVPWWKLLAGQMGTAGGMSVGTMFLGDISDGYVDRSWQEYALNFGAAVTTAGIGFGVGMGVKAIAQHVGPVSEFLTQNAIAPFLIIGGETVIDVAVDWGVSKVFHQEYNLTMSILTSLASNIAFSIDPVNMATGGFCLTATDLILPDLTDGNFRLQRVYNSVAPCRGVLGKNWMLGLESRLFIHEEGELIDAICMDGHAERFALEDGEWRNRRNGDSRYRMQKTDGEEEGYVLIYIPEQKCYDYDGMGRLVSVRGKGKNRLTVSYQEAHISQVVTSAGYVLDFKYEGDRVCEIRDEAGRTVRYKYENDCLKAVCHVDEGVTTYHYDEGNHITQVIDQNGHAYVRNEYDHAGRVTAQYYLDGTRSILTYDPEKRENTVYIEGLGRTERYRYNEDFLVTHTYYDDGTWEETGYDQWTNHVYEKDRNGNITRRLYDSMGRLCRETLPSGQTWECRYDDGGNLLEKKADTGEEFRYAYDEYGFLIEEAEKIREGEWKRRRYGRDDHGRMTSMTDSLGHTTSYDYGSMDRHLLKEPSTTEDALGNQTCYEYDIIGRRTCIRTDLGDTRIRYNRQNYPVSVQDGNGNELCRTYDSMGNLTAMTPPAQGADGSCWIYRYDFFDRLVETIDPLGNIWRKERNLAGDILREEAPDGKETRYEYDTDSRKLRTVYADGSVERCFYDGNGNLVRKVMPEDYDAAADDGPGITYTYDSMNRLTQETGRDGRILSTYHYDASGNLTEQTDSAGYSTFYTYDLLGSRTGMWEPVEVSGEDGETVLYRATLYEYDAEANKIKELRGTDKVKAGEIPQHAHELCFTYDALNRLTAVEDQHGAKAVYRYNSRNQKVYESFRISGDVERVIRYAYDAAGNMVEKCEGTEERFLKPGGKRRRVWAATRYEYDPDGNCVRMVTPNGYEKEWQYDALDRMVSEKEQDRAGGICRSFRYEYDTVGNLRVRRDHSMGKTTERRFCYDQKNRLTHLTDEGGNTTRLFYDRNDRIIKAVRPQQYDPAGDDGQGTCYLYDGSGRIVRITGPDGTVLQEQAYDSAGNIRTRLEGQSVYTEYAHDLAGDLLAVYKGRENARKNRAAQRMEYDAWGNVTGAEDGNGNRTGFSLDGWGRIVAVHTPEGGVERYTYDHAGNITSTTDASGGTITYDYNSMGKVYQVTDQEGRSEYFHYDAEGRLETRTDRNGNRETTRYNMDGNLKYRRAEDGKGRNPAVYRYLYYPDGKLKQAEGGGITYEYAYTENGLLKGKSASGKPLLRYAYDRSGNLSCLTDSTGRSIHYTYDAMDRLQQVADGQGETLASYSYNRAGGLQKLRYGNGIQTEYEYGDDGNLSSLVTVTGQGRVILNLGYAYDGNGNCTRKAGGQFRNEYAYDRMNRLVQTIQDGKTERYTYDLAGNRLRKESGRETEVYQYNAKNQLTSLRAGDTTTRYRYDPQGNLLEERGDTWTKRYTYDAANRQTGIELTGPSETTPGCFRQISRYDGEGLRYETEENGKTIRFLYDRGELAEEIGEDSRTSYTRGYDPLVLTRDGAEGSYFVPDEMGSTLFLLDKDHEIRKTYHYDAFGAIKEETGEISNRLTFTGQMYDGETGQYYLRARFYNPSIGRFTQEDIYRGDGLNLYAYCANNPIVYYDPYGLAKKQLLCVGGKTAAQCETFDEVQYFSRVSQAPKDNKGTWVSGIRGEGLFIPSNKKILDLLIDEYGVIGVWYTHGVPDFSPFAVETVTIKNMRGGHDARKYNFPQADEYIGSIYGMKKENFAEVRSNRGYTWHECNDMITMQMIPSDINSYFGHLGGVGEINLLNQQAIKSIWNKFPNWKK